jgi:hypothetical protein
MPQRGEPQTGSEPLQEEAPGFYLSAWPMIVGVGAAAVILDLLCSWIRRGSLPKIGVLIVAASLLCIAVMISGFVVRAIYARISLGARRVSTPVLRAACLTALWVPAWILFIETWSLLMILAACLCLASLGIFLKQCSFERVASGGRGSSPQVPPKTPFLLDSPALGRLLLPSILLALLAEVAIVLVGARWYPSASMAWGIFAAVLGWRAVSVLSIGTAKPVLPGSRQAIIVTTAFVLTVIALLPYLRVSPFRGSLIRAKTIHEDGSKTNSPETSDGYSGIILLPLSVQHRRIVVPVKHDSTSFSTKFTQPMEIPFDGVYWYFKPPDKAPRPTAQVVRGSSTKAVIRSSDRYPLLMEAHQKLEAPLDLGCCSAMELVVENADHREGAIALELWVRKRADPMSKSRLRVNAVSPEQAPHYLGTMAIPSSESTIGMRADVPGKRAEEKLRFPIPAAMDGILFDEITIVVKSAPARARAGAQIAILKFVLEP